jgi:TRAP transporter TAXI family solute receptor
MLATRRRFLEALLDRSAVLMALACAGCDVREFARRHGGKLRLSIATGPIGGSYYAYGAALSSVIGRHVPNVEITVEVTSASVDNLQLLATGRADLGFTLAPTLLDAFRGVGAFARLGPVPVRALATVSLQRMHLVTLDGLGVHSLEDLRGRVVSLGQPGAGSEDVALRVLRAVGIDPDRDIERQGLGLGAAADAVKDGKLDAFFWTGGAGLPTLVDLAITSGHRMRLIDLAATVEPLQHTYGTALFRPALIASRYYPGVEHDVPTVGTPNMLVADAALSEVFVYDVTRALFGEAQALAKFLPDARELSLELGPTGSPVPYHPGAVRYYREQGAWPS